jgi:hypothetical protein
VPFSPPTPPRRFHLLAYSLPGGNCNNGDAVCDVIREAAGILKDASCLWTLWLQRRPKRSFREPHSRKLTFVVVLLLLLLLIDSFGPINAGNVRIRILKLFSQTIINPEDRIFEVFILSVVVC